MFSAERNPEQHEDIILSGCYAEFRVEPSTQSTVKGRMLLLTKALCMLWCKITVQKKGQQLTEE